MSDHHDEPPLPPPEVDRLNFLSIFIWGLFSFVLVLFTIFALGSYFWGEREDIYSAKVSSASAYASLRNIEKAQVVDRLSGTKTLWGIRRGAVLEASFNSEAAAKNALRDKSADEINARELVELERYQIPIEQAIKQIAANRGAPLPPAPTFEVAKELVASAPVKPGPFAVDTALASKGKQLFGQKICTSCHSVDGSRLVGPTMKGIWGRHERLSDGREIYVNEAYFRRSVKAPMEDVVEGYPPAMPAIPLTDDEVTAILHYVASIN